MNGNFGTAIKWGLGGMSGTALGSLLTNALPHTTQVTGDWVVDLKTICAVGFVVVGGSWHVSRWMTKVDERLEFLERSQKCPAAKEKTHS